MLRIAIIGGIGSGKSYVAKAFGYPVFNADLEVGKLYKKNRKCYKKLRKKLPKYIYSFPVSKNQIIKAISAKENNLKIIIKIIHPEIKKRMQQFIKKNKNKKFVVLDIPLLIENKINTKNDILIYVDTPKKLVYQKLKKRPNFDPKIFNKFKKLQLPVEVKRRKADYIIKNNFRGNLVKKNVKKVIKRILFND